MDRAPTVRLLRPVEVEAVVALLHDAFAEYRDRLDPPSGAHRETATTIRQRLARADCLVVDVDGRLAGCVFVEPQPGRLYLSRLAVRPAARGRGLGAALIAAVENRARAAGIDRVGLDARLALVDQRRRYERLGYVVVGLGTHPGYPTPTFARYEKIVTPAGSLAD